jgi:hypothetical protein
VKEKGRKNWDERKIDSKGVKMFIKVHSWALTPLSAHSNIGLCPTYIGPFRYLIRMKSNPTGIPDIGLNISSDIYYPIFDKFTCLKDSTYSATYISGEIQDSSCGTCLLF